MAGYKGEGHHVCEVGTNSRPRGRLRLPTASRRPPVDYRGRGLVPCHGRREQLSAIFGTLSALDRNGVRHRWNLQ